MTLTELWQSSQGNPNRIKEAVPVSQPSAAIPTIHFPSYNRVKVYENSDIQRLAPSVFADRPWGEMSDNYRFIPTISMVNTFRSMGYNVTMAAQSRTRIEGKRDFIKHIVRLRHNDFLSPINVGDEVPEIVLVNSHSGMSSYKLMLRFFRLVCSNGMIVASSMIDSLSIRHTGRVNLLDEVIDVSARIIEEAPKAISQINRFKAIDLQPAEQIAFAKSALELGASTLKLSPERLLQARRQDDKGDSLWKVTNRIQENLIKGGIYGYSDNGRFRRTREITSIDSNVGINKAIWRLTEEMAALKTG